MPLHTTVLPGLVFHGTSREALKVLLQASFDNLNTLADVSEEMVQGRGTKLLIIITSYVKLLNHIQEHVTYSSTTYLLDVVDMMNFTDGTYLVRFPVTIRQLHLPKLFDSGPDNSIRNMVTITIKAFLCYHKLQILMKSIKQYYPDITVIVADDSEHPEKIEEANVQHYIMPFGKGWFAGRNLAISQVTTKYYLWVDDDFIFTEITKIGKFMDVLEKSNLDANFLWMGLEACRLAPAMMLSLVTSHTKFPPTYKKLTLKNCMIDFGIAFRKNLGLNCPYITLRTE